MKNIILLATLLILIPINSSAQITPEKTNISNLLVEYTKEPLGIDVEKPRFSWQMKNLTKERGYSQSAYQLIVTDDSGKEVWNTGKVTSNVSLNIEYKGNPLKPKNRYYWKVNVWDQKDNLVTALSRFETGLMNPDPGLSAWNGAKWIGGADEDMVIYPSYLPVFKLSYSVQLDKKSKTKKAGFIYGANDSRLMDKNKNIYNIQSPQNESYIMIETDITNVGTDASQNAMLHIYRVGYHPNDKKDVPYKSVPIPATLINDKNKYDNHTVYISSVYGQTHIHIDGIEKENLVTELHLNPVGNSGDFITFPVIADIGYAVPSKKAATFSQVEIRNYRSPSNILFTDKPGKIDGGKSGAFNLTQPQRNAMPMLRTAFKTNNSKIVKARLYVTSRGIYEVYMNGKRVGDDMFNPGLTQYPETHLYQTYDVMNYLNPGENAVGALLAEGWWSGGATYSGQLWNFFGDRQSLLAQLVITYEDGQEQVITTNPDTWKYYNDGPILYGSFFQGEVYDASKEAAIQGWTTPGYNDSQWKRATEVTLANHIAREIPQGMPQVSDYSKMSLTGQFGETAAKVKELTAIAVEEVRPGVYVYDMGQNMVGVPKINLSGMEAGKKITLRFAEVKYPDLPEYKDNIGMIMLENIRAAMAQDIYFTKGGNETINPRFTFHGYRFVEITGIDKPLPVQAVKGDVISSIRELASYYETSNPKVNKLWQNITWSTLGNFLSIPTDCAQRNERMGWSGDISVYSRTATYMSNIPQFLRRHMLAMRNTQREDGRFADVAPLGGGFGGILWGSAGITVAWESYMQYNDKVLLAEHYDAMKRYIQYILDNSIDPKTNIIVQERSWGNLGDWLGPEDGRNDKSLLWEAYFIYDLELMHKIANALEKKEDAARFNKLYTERKEFFNKTYLQPDTRKTIHSSFDETKKENIIDTQTSYVLPLSFNLVAEEDKSKILNNLSETIIRENKADNEVICPPYSLMTGFIGTAWITRALSGNGATDIAYRLLQQTSYPSWLYSVDQGSTTIWERLNSYTHTHGFGGNNSMNSFNHYSFGAVGSWMYNYSLGIERDERYPGFKHFILKPETDPTGEMTFAYGHYDSMYGTIWSGWKIKNGISSYVFIVPANTTVTLYLPAPSLESIQESDKPVLSSNGVKYTGLENGKYVFELQSGEYEFTYKNTK